MTASNESGAFDGFLHSRDAQALLCQLSQGTEVLSAPGPVPREVPGYRNCVATRLASRTSRSKSSECSEIPNTPQSPVLLLTPELQPRGHVERGVQREQLLANREKLTGLKA